MTEKFKTKYIEVSLDAIQKGLQEHSPEVVKFFEKLPIADKDKIVKAIKKIDSSESFELSKDDITFRIEAKYAQLFGYDVETSSNSLTFLHLPNNLKNEDIGEFVQFLQANKLLKNIDLSGNNLGDDSIKNILATLQHNEVLEILDLSGNNITDATQILALNQSLIVLDLSDNNLEVDGAKSLATSLANNSSLGALYLEKNNLGDDGVITLVQSLKTNKTLFALNLRDNAIGPKGADAIIDLLETNHSITNIFLSQKDVESIGPEKIEKINTLLNGNHVIKDQKGRSSILESNDKISKILAEYVTFGDLSDKEIEDLKEYSEQLQSQENQGNIREFAPRSLVGGFELQPSKSSLEYTKLQEDGQKDIPKATVTLAKAVLVRIESKGL
jgi:Ran GTPase-activating protein (RanGAP) involved in mRNA processing and transport